MSALAPLAPRLCKLIPLFGSDQDGEALGAVRAAERLLKGAGLDWHSLAAEVRGSALSGTEIDRGPSVSPRSWGAVARWCSDNGQGRLSRKERRFVRDMSHRLVWGGKPTEKQAAWLWDIYRRLRGGHP